MTQITDRPMPQPPRPRILEGDAPLSKNELAISYLRRIHWWVRLAGIIWIVIPVVLAVLAAVFLVGAAANSSSGAGY